ncbi:hypothetical protein Tco_0489710 [Tanacetum coccineum]
MLTALIREMEGIRSMGELSRGEGGVLEPTEGRRTKIVLKRNLIPKEKTTSKDNVESERLRLERIEREQRTIDDEIDDDLDDTLEAMNTQKMKGIAEYETEETKIPTDA